jgi:uncharacterized protein (TIGR00725 family)
MSVHTPPRTPIIAIIGAGRCTPKQKTQAAEIGRYIAEHGGIVVCGGLGGVMEGAARGAKEAGGTTIGILPGESKSAANPYIDIAIPTGMNEARNVLVVRAADAVIALPGKFGTLTEMGFALIFGKPLVSLGAWRLGGEVTEAESPQEAAKLAMELATRSL